MSEIFKVQLPIVASDAISMATVLVYNADRSIIGQVPLTEDVNKLLNGELKSFWYAELNDQELKLIRKAPWQDW